MSCTGSGQTARDFADASRNRAVMDLFIVEGPLHSLLVSAALAVHFKHDLLGSLVPTRTAGARCVRGGADAKSSVHTPEKAAAKGLPAHNAAGHHRGHVGAGKATPGGRLRLLPCR